MQSQSMAAAVAPRLAAVGGLTGAAIAAVGLALSASAFWISRSVDSDRVRAGLDVRADWRTSDIRHHVEHDAESLRVIATFVEVRAETNNPIDQAQFQSVAHQAYDDAHVPLRAVIWAPRVRHEEIESFLRSARRLRTDDYRLLDRAPGGATVAAAARAEYFPVLFDATFEGQRGVPGLTFDSEPARRAAMERARDSGAVTAADAVPLFTGDGRQLALLAFWPVYKGGRRPDTVEARRRDLLGFVIGVFRLDAALANAIRDTPGVLSTITLFGAGEGGAMRPVVQYRPDRRAIVMGPDIAAPESAYRVVRAPVILGRSWRVEFDYAPEVVADLRSTAPWGWLAAGLLLTGILFIVFAQQGARRRAVEALVTARTAGLDRANADLRREVDRRQRSEAASRETSELLQAMFDESPFAVVALDPARRVLLWSRAAERIFGYGAAEVIGRPYPLVPAEGQAEFDGIIARVTSGERLRAVSVRRRRKDDTLADVIFSGAPLYTADGALRAMLFVLEDVTERRGVERQLQQALRMEAVGQLTSGIAHDFNNLLGIVVGNLDLAAERLAADPKTRELIESALQGALRGAELVQRLLAFSRRQPLAPQAIDLNERLPELTALLQRTLGQSIEVVARPAPSLWPAVADPAQLENALLNLAINARDAMPNGGALTIETANTSLDENYAAQNPEAAPGDYVSVAVSDTGTGMPPDVIERAFEPFFTTKEVGKGSGLGLAMIHGFVKQSRGHVKIYSEVGHGTTVKIYLPRADRAPTAPAAEERRDDAPRGHESILVVEDNPEIRTVAERLLTELGYRVRMAENGPAALAILDAGDAFDLLFTDIVMPGGLSGYDVAAEARKRRPGLKVLFTTGFAEASLRNGKHADADVVGKPYRKSELARAIRRALDRTQGEAT
jgi:PAS domain S-box-containing protein